MLDLRANLVPLLGLAILSLPPALVTGTSWEPAADAYSTILGVGLAGYNVYAVRRTLAGKPGLPAPLHALRQFPLGIVWWLGMLPHLFIVLFLAFASASAPPLLFAAFAYAGAVYFFIPALLIGFARSGRFRDLLNFSKAFQLFKAAPGAYFRTVLPPLMLCGPVWALAHYGLSAYTSGQLVALCSYLGFVLSVLLEQLFVSKLKYDALCAEPGGVGLNPTSSSEVRGALKSE